MNALKAYRSSWLALALLGGASSLAAESRLALPEPPEPDPALLVDFVQWYNDVHGEGIRDNAAPLYLQSYEEMNSYEGDWNEALAGPWSENETMIAWLDDNRQALELFKSAAFKPDCFFALNPPEGEGRMDGSMLHVLLPSLAKHRTLAKACIAEGYLAHAGGDETVLVDNALIVIRCGHQLDTSPMLIERLVGQACLQLAYDALTRALELSDDPDALATETLPRLVAVDPAITNMHKSFLTERLSYLDVAQRIFVPTEDGRGYTLCGPDEINEGLGFGGLGLWGRWTLFAAGFEQTVAAGMEHYDQLDEIAALPYTEAEARSEELEASVDWTSNPLVRILVPSLSRAREIGERIETRRQAVHTLYRCFAYHHRLQQWPATLNDLRDAPPVDLYTGKPLVYRKTADGFMLYSIGADRIDDRGRHASDWGEGDCMGQEAEGGDYVFWPRPE